MWYIGLTVYAILLILFMVGWKRWQDRVNPHAKEAFLDTEPMPREQ